MLGPFATRAAARPISRCRYRYCRAPPAHRCPRRQQQRVTEGTAMAPWNWPNKPVPYTFVCINRRNNEVLWARASLFRRFTDTNVRGTDSVKIWETRHKLTVNIRIFFIV